MKKRSENNCSNAPRTNWSEIEIYRIEFDYLKHLTTICTGSILLIVAFLEKLFTQPEWKAAIIISLCSFISSVVLCAISQALIIEIASERKDREHINNIQNWIIGLLLLSLLSYVVGIICLAAFGVKNLL